MSGWTPSQSSLKRAIAMTPIMRTSMKPQWREVRDRLQAEGLSPSDVVLTEWVTEGDANMGAIIATLEGRVFDVMVVEGFDRDRRNVARDEGFVSSFREVAPDKITVTGDGNPNVWLAAVRIARLVLEQEGATSPE